MHRNISMVKSKFVPIGKAKSGQGTLNMSIITSHICTSYLSLVNHLNTYTVKQMPFKFNI